jgi:uncharacterized membrane protein
MTRYEILKFLHVVGAIAWVGGGLGLLLYSQQLVRARDYAGLLTIGRHSKALGTWLFMPAALLTVGFGIALVATEAAFRFRDLWILIGFGGVIASGVMQMALAEPAAKRFMGLAEEHGADHPDVAAAARKVNVGSFFDVGILLLVVWAMVAKPTL